MRLRHSRAGMFIFKKKEEEKKATSKIIFKLVLVCLWYLYDLLQWPQPREAMLLKQVTGAIFNQHREQAKSLKPVYAHTYKCEHTNKKISQILTHYALQSLSSYFCNSLLTLVKYFINLFWYTLTKKIFNRSASYQHLKCLKMPLSPCLARAKFSVAITNQSTNGTCTLQKVSKHVSFVYKQRHRKQYL